jgi:BirA family biotin operon repressor/biotin-[acetyl-CoA-carboxylase] ligase
VYLSVGLEVSANVQAVSALSPLMALAVRDALAAFTREPVLIKWPNDVLVPTGKLAGILVELKQGHAIVGVGINVNRPGEGAFAGSGYLDDGASASQSLENVAAAVITSMLGYYAIWRDSDFSFASFASSYQENLSMRGDQVCVRDAAGAEIASGTVQGIDESGRLLLAGSKGILAVSAGEITLRS